MPAQRLAKLPQLLDRKIYKTGQTRGADDDEIYQNRVLRPSTVLIPYKCWELCAKPKDGSNGYENGFIVLIPPADYFGRANITAELTGKGLSLGQNALVFYETREQWQANNPAGLKWKPAKRRTSPLDGNYVARIPATTVLDTGAKLFAVSTRPQTRAQASAFTSMRATRQQRSAVFNSKLYSGFVWTRNKSQSPMG